MLVHDWLEATEGTPPVLLGAIQRSVGGMQQRLLAVAIAGEKGDPDGSSDLDRGAAKNERQRYRLDEPVRQFGQALGSIDSGHYDKFIPAYSRHRIGGPK